MNVRWLVGLMTVKVEPKPIQSQYRGHLCAQSMTSEVREERGGSWVESRKLSQVCQLKWVSLLFSDKEKTARDGAVFTFHTCLRVAPAV